MNRKRCFLIIGLFTLLFTSCNKVKTENIIGKVGQKSEIIVQDTIETQSQNDMINVKINQKESGSPVGINYKVIDEKYIDKEIIITYPQIINLSDENKQKTINEILRSEALIVLGLYEDSCDVSLEVNYKITWQSQNIFSLQYFGIAYANGAAYPLNLLYTVNINMDNGFKLLLRDFVKIDKTFVNNFKNYKVKDPEINHASANAFDYIINTYSVEDLIRYFEGADSSYNNSAFTFSYFTKDAFGISIEVPHVVGDHMEIELKYEDIKENVRNENEIWKDFLNLR